MLTVLGGLAEFERELIRARTGEGRKLANKLGSELVGVLMGGGRQALASIAGAVSAGRGKADSATGYFSTPSKVRRLKSRPNSPECASSLANTRNV